MGKNIKKLTNDDKSYLKRIGFNERDFIQIEQALNDVDLSITDNDIIRGCKTRKCGVDRSIEVLGRETFISGLSRAAYHATATRVSENKRFEIHFDLCKWWR